jgi:hypothetical protein
VALPHNCDYGFNGAFGQDMAVDADGNAYVLYCDSVMKIAPNGATFPISTTYTPERIAINPDNQALRVLEYCSDLGQSCIQTIGWTGHGPGGTPVSGGFVSLWNNFGGAVISEPLSMKIGQDGIIWTLQGNRFSYPCQPGWPPNFGSGLFPCLPQGSPFYGPVISAYGADGRQLVTPNGDAPAGKNYFKELINDYYNNQGIACTHATPTNSGDCIEGTKPPPSYTIPPDPGNPFYQMGMAVYQPTTPMPYNHINAYVLERSCQESHFQFANGYTNNEVPCTVYNTIVPFYTENGDDRINRRG